ncbi:MAG: flagellar hook-length control protein FliK [Anaerovibrio sp.]
MSSNVNLLSVGAGSTAKVSVKASVKTASSQGSDFSKTLDQAQQARSKDTAKPESDYKSAAKDESTKDVQPEKPEAADGKEKADAANADTQPENAGDASDVQEKGEAGSQPPADGNDNTATDANPAAAMAAAMAEGVIATQGQQPLAELNSYFKGDARLRETPLGSAENTQQTAGQQQTQPLQQFGEQKQPLDSLQTASAMEEMAPVDADTPSVSQSSQAVQQPIEQKQPVSNVPNSIEALLGSRQQSQQTANANANAAQGRTDNGQQLLNMLPGQRTFTTVQENSAAPQTENTVGINQLNDLVGQVEIVQGEGNSRGFAQQQNQNQQGGMTNSQSQQQGMQMPGEAAFDVVVPGEEITQENSLGKSQQDNVASFQQILGNAQNTDNAGAINEPQQTNRTYNVPQQIVEQAKLLQNGQNSEMIIKLNPEHLGELSLKVSVNGNGGVTATFHTDNAQVRAILETSMIQLKQQLNEQGIKVDNIDVQTGLPDGQLPDGQAQQGFYQQEQGQHVRSQQIDLKDFEDTSDALAAEPVNNAATDIHDSEGNVISSGVDYSV